MNHLNWIWLSILTGIFFGLQAVLIKVLSLKIDRFTILSFLFTTTGLLLLPLAVTHPGVISSMRFFPSFLTSFILNIFAYLLLVRAIRISPVSIVMPFVGFTPVFLIISGYLILGEVVTAGKGAGIILIIIGGFILQMPQEAKGQSGWPKLFNIREKGIGLMLLVAFIWSITASVEKIAVKASSPAFYGAVINLSLGLFFVLAILIKKGIKARENKINRSLLAGLVLLGVTSAVLAISQLTAIKITLVANVIAFKRAGVIVSTLAGFLLFKEKNYFKASVGTLLVIAGTVLISFFG